MQIILLKFRIQLLIDRQKTFDTSNLATEKDFNIILCCLLFKVYNIVKESIYI